MTSPIPLRDIATIVMGQSPPGETYNTARDGLPFFQGKAEFGDVSPTPVKWCSAPNRIAEAGDILLSVRAPVGPINIAAERCCIGRGLAAIRAKDGSALTRYLGYFFRRFESEISRQGVGSTFTAINRNDIERLLIPLPPLSEQERLVRLLDEADALRRLRARADERMSDFIPALFHEMFGDPVRNEKGWPKAKMAEITRIDAGMVDPREEQYLDLPHVGPERIEKETGKLLPAKTAREDSLISAKYLFDERHVLYSKIRPYLRKAALPTGKGLCSADMYPLLPANNKITREFLWQLLLSKAFTDYTEGFSKRANMPKVNREQIGAYEMMLPPLSLQYEFAARVAEARALEEKQAQSAARLEALFESMLAQAFAGEL